MRTTVTLDDDVYEAARKLSDSSGKRLGEVLSDLARRSLALGSSGIDRGGRFAAVALPPEAPRISAKRVQQALDDEGYF